MPKIASSDDHYVVSTPDFAALLVPLLEQLRAEHETAYDCRGTTDDGKLGAFASLATDVGRALDITKEAVIRRLFDIRKLRRITTGLDFVDAVLIYFDIRLDDADLPIFPATVQTARAMIAVRYPRMPVSERNRLARQLHKFSRAYLDAAAPQETHDYVALELEKTHRRRARRAAREAAAQQELVAA